VPGIGSEPAGAYVYVGNWLMDNFGGYSAISNDWSYLKNKVRNK